MSGISRVDSAKRCAVGRFFCLENYRRRSGGVLAVSLSRLSVAMASFARLALPQRAWTIEEHALFAARKEFELLKLLSTDNKALATARRLGFMTNAGHPQSHTAAASRAAAPAALSAAGADDSSTPSRTTTATRRAASRARRTRQANPQPQPPPPLAAGVGGTAGGALSRGHSADGPSATIGSARQRRSAARSALRHAARRRLIRSQMLAILFALKLRRRARLHRGLAELEELAVPDHPGDAAKRGRSSSRSDSDVSDPSSSADALEYEHHHVMGVVRTSTRAPPTKRVGQGAWHAGPALW